MLFRSEIENINRPTTSTEIETVIKNLPTNKSPGPDGFTGKIYQTFRQELTPSLLKLSPKLADEGTLQSSFYKATMTLIPNQTKISHKKRIFHANITDEQIRKNPQQNTSKPNPTTH